MKANELMIGDWVICNHYLDKPFYNRFGLGDFIKGDYDFCEPIPITPEILEKNGFKLKEEGKTYTMYVSVWNEISIISFAFFKETICGVDTLLECELGFAGGVNRIHHCHIKYVHQLQHALRMCGIEKEIVL